MTSTCDQLHHCQLPFVRKRVWWYKYVYRISFLEELNCFCKRKIVLSKKILIFFPQSLFEKSLFPKLQNRVGVVQTTPTTITDVQKSGRDIPAILPQTGDSFIVSIHHSQNHNIPMYHYWDQTRHIYCKTCRYIVKNLFCWICACHFQFRTFQKAKTNSLICRTITSNFISYLTREAYQIY